MSEEHIAKPTYLARTAILGMRNIYDFLDALLEVNELFKRSLSISVDDFVMMDVEHLDDLVKKLLYFTE